MSAAFAVAGCGTASKGRGQVHGARCPPDRSDSDMQPVLLGYLPILVFIVIAGVIAVAMVGGSLIAARQKPYPEKVSPYECGFEPFDDARRRFDVRFYLVAILFIIFDLEVAFLFPWAVSLKDIGWFGFLSMIGFLAVLTVGFIYEWCKGALDWE
jgi:NADH-quinone oxidoreductase subunit A